MLEYKGYKALLEVKVDDGVIAGRVLGIRDVVTFEGDTVAEAEQAFRDSVDDYLDFCAKSGVSPETPLSGKFLLRITPELHRALTTAAELEGTSLNSYVEEALERTVRATQRSPGVARHLGTSKVRKRETSDGGTSS